MLTKHIQPVARSKGMGMERVHHRLEKIHIFCTHGRDLFSNAYLVVSDCVFQNGYQWSRRRRDSAQGDDIPGTASEHGPHRHEKILGDDGSHSRVLLHQRKQRLRRLHCRNPKLWSGERFGHAFTAVVIRRAAPFLCARHLHDGIIVRRSAASACSPEQR